MSEQKTSLSQIQQEATQPWWKKKLRVGAGVAILAIIALIYGARFITSGDLPGCDSRNAKDALSDIFKQGKLEFSHYVEIKTLKKTETEITCFASLAKTAGGSAEFDYRIFFEEKTPKWPAPGFVDTRLSESRLHLELHGT